MGVAPTLHRKQWEHFYIAQALSERGLLQPHMRGLGFAVGREPLPSLFATFECEIVASDWYEDAARAAGWVGTDQHASNLEVLNERGLCAPDLFQKRVSFRVVDMNQIPGDLRNFDFLWSSCSLEHLGSIEKGEQFIYNALECLRPGGVAVHTTEFNLSSNDHTVDHEPTVLFRRRDIERVAARLAAMGHEIELDFSEGNGTYNRFVDVPPYRSDPHLRLLISDYVCTSIGLIIRKASSASALQAGGR
jgi:SAM-dependent methyltransferase